MDFIRKVLSDQDGANLNDDSLDKIYAQIQLETKGGWIEPPSYRVLVISDWHLDLEYHVGSTINDCNHTLCCRKSSGMALNIELGARKYGELALCDLPEITAREQIQWLKQNLRGDLKPDLILWTGDSASHDITGMTEESLIETLKTLTNIIKISFSDVPLVVSIGNHDFDPANF